MKLLKHTINLGTKYFSTGLHVQEVRIPVPWGYIAGKWWGPTNQRPILTLHGWQDNCGSFDRLLPLLNQDKVGFLSIDFPGHGYSSRLPPGMYYHSINYVILIEYLVNYFQWPKITLLGHSLGGSTSLLYAMLNLQSVDFLMCADGIKQHTIPKNNKRMAEVIKNFIKHDEFSRSTNEPPSYTMEEIKSKICAQNTNSISHKYCHFIIERNIAPSKLFPGKYYFTRDPRLKGGPLLNFPHNEIVEYAKQVESPIFIAKAKEASYYEEKQNYYDVADALKKSSKDFDFHYVEGTHHVHLNSPENLAKLLNNFIQKHIKDDRYITGEKYQNMFNIS